MKLTLPGLIVATAVMATLATAPVAMADPTTPPTPTATSSTSATATPTGTPAAPIPSPTAPNPTPTSPATPTKPVTPTVTVTSGTKTGLPGQPLTASGTTTATDATTAATEVYLNGKWLQSQLTAVFTHGAFVLPLTYGNANVGTLTWRLRVDTPAGPLWSASFTTTRLSTAPTITSAPTSVTTDATGSVTVKVANTGVGRPVVTQFLLSGKWVQSQARTTNSSGVATIPLTYGSNVPGKYTWRVAASNAYGVVSASASRTLTRTKPDPKSVPSVWKACSVTLQGVTVPIGRTEHSRIIVSGVSGAHATIGLYVRDRTTACAFSTSYRERGWIGSAGLRSPAARSAGDNSTPIGTFPMTESYGSLANPGTILPYHRSTNSDYWVWDPSSKYFNTLRSVSQGGFNWGRSEHIFDYDYYYKYAIVIDFNRNPVVAKSRGGGIRFHLSNGAPTQGCVAIGMGNLRTTMTTVVSGDRITITR